MQYIAYVVPFVIGAFFLWLAFLYFGREKYPTATFYGVIAALFFFSSFPWFQGLAKTWIISNVNSKLKALGDQIDDVQKTTADMHGQLSAHQKQIDSHQKELQLVQAKIQITQNEVSGSQADITNQFVQLLSLQGDLAMAQTNLLAQQKKIEDVEYLISNLSARKVFEEYAAADKEHVVTYQSTNGEMLVVVVLNHIPVPNSITASVFSDVATDGNPILSARPYTFKETIKPIKNLLFHRIFGYRVSNTVLSYNYIKDTRETNLLKKVEFKDGHLFIENTEIPFPPGAN